MWRRFILKHRSFFGVLNNSHGFKNIGKDTLWELLLIISKVKQRKRSFALFNGRSIFWSHAFCTFIRLRKTWKVWNHNIFMMEDFLSTYFLHIRLCKSLRSKILSTSISGIPVGHYQCIKTWRVHWHQNLRRAIY